MSFPKMFEEFRLNLVLKYATSVENFVRIGIRMNYAK
jgi:hypothetical protein